MIPWVRLDAVQLDDGPELKLMQRGSEFSIMLGTNELMNSRLSGSEEALATLAWARLDIDRGAGVALIEEIQSDWLRFVRWELDDLRHLRPRSRALRDTQAYEAALTARYEQVWPRAVLLAALKLLRDRLRIAEIYYHQPGPGAVLKHSRPPVSLYSSLRKAFCFEPTRDVPPFLRRKRRKHLSRLPKDRPLFWKMAF